ncbi:50S ribosomal protein L11 methyltransferase [Guggenheimella bovis]
MKRLKIYLPHEDVEHVEEKILLAAINGMEIIDSLSPLYKEMNWYEDERFIPEITEVQVIIVYAEEKVLEALRKQYKKKYKVEIEELEEQNWNKLWEQSFQGTLIHDKVFVRPPWIEPLEDKIDILIDPGMAFGTGTHETTKGCITALIKYMRPTYDVLDVGSGSGILSILAKKFGACHLEAVEIDSMAVKNAMLNQSLNGIHYIQHEGDKTCEVEGTFDLVLANILPEVHKHLYKDFLRLVKPGGIIILSGILDSREEEMLDYFKGFEHVETFPENDWVTVVLKRTL